MWYQQSETGMPNLLQMRNGGHCQSFAWAGQSRMATDGASQNRLGVAATRNERHAQKEEADVEREEPGSGFKTGKEKVTGE